MVNIEFSIFVNSSKMNLHGVFVFELFTAVLTSIHQGMRKVNALNVVQQVVFPQTCFLAYGAFKHLGLGVEHGILLEQTSHIFIT